MLQISGATSQLRESSPEPAGALSSTNDPQAASRHTDHQEASRHTDDMGLSELTRDRVEVLRKRAEEDRAFLAAASKMEKAAMQHDQVSAA